LAKNDKIEIHARFVQEGYYSAIDQIGVKISEGKTVVIDSSGMLYVDESPTEILKDALDLDGGFSIEYFWHPAWVGYTIMFPPAGDEKESFYLTVTIGSKYGRLPDDGHALLMGHATKQKLTKEGGELVEVGKVPFGEKESSSMMSFKIHAHGSLFEGSEGLCGNWDNDTLLPPGMADRDGNEMSIPFLYPNFYFAYDATVHGDEWRVDSSGTTDSQVLDVVNGTPDDSNKWSKDECVAMNTDTQNRHLQQLGDRKCGTCERVSGVVGTLNCYYDVQALSPMGDCDYGFETAAFYEPESTLFYPMNGLESDFQCLDVVQAIKYANKSGSASKKAPKKASKGKTPNDSRRLGSRELGKHDDKKVKKCEDAGGICVVFCDTQSEDYDCLFDLCDVDIEHGTMNTILAFGQYYNACSCKISKN